MSLKIGLLSTHPIQYYSPWFKDLAKKTELEVFFAHQQNSRGQSEAGFGVEFEWDTDLLNGYSYRWLKNVSKKPGIHRFLGCDTPEIYKIIRNERFDAFVIFGWNYKSALQAAIACRIYNVPVFMRGDSHLLTKRSVFKRLFKYLPYRILLPLINHLYVGKLNKEYLQYYGVPDKKLFFVPHFVDNEYFYKSSQRCTSNKMNLQIRNKFNIPEESFVILFVGKLIDKKRPFDIIDALININDKNIHVLFIGDGPLRSKLKDIGNIKNNNIHFAGFINQSELPCYYSAGDVLVLPSDGGETWGLVVNEAMASGIPAIVSDKVGCAPDLIEQGKTGFVFEMGNISSLVKAIGEAYTYSKNNSEVIKDRLKKKTMEYSIEAASANFIKAIGDVNK